MFHRKRPIIKIAEQQIACEFRFADTAGYFDVLQPESDNSQAFCYVHDAEIDFWRHTGKPYDAYAEYSMISIRISDTLLPRSSCVFHAVSFLHKGKAWLIAAPPGVGKSTQYKYLSQLFPSEFQIISGDKPVLEFRDKKIIVHPSPWNGKEGWRSNESGILEGIILLSRDTDNSIERIKAKDAIIPVYRSVVQSAETEQEVSAACQMTENILNNCKVWRMTTNTVPDSTKMLYKEVFTAYE